MNEFNAGNAGEPQQPQQPQQPYPSLPPLSAAPSGFPSQQRPPSSWPPSGPRGASAPENQPLDQLSTQPQRTPFYPSAPGAPKRRRGGGSRWFIAVSAIVVGIIVLAGAGAAVSLIATNSAHTSEQQAKAALDAALVTARAQYNVPPSRLQPIVDAEKRAVASTDASYGGYHATQTKLVSLTGQVNALIHTPPAQARTLTQSDLTSLSAGVSGLVKGNFIEASGFQQRLQQAQTQFAAAGTTPQYFAVDTIALDQLGAVNAFQPTYQRIQDFTTLITNETKLLNGALPTTNDLQCAQGQWDAFWLDDPLVQVTSSVPNAITTAESQWPAKDITLLRAASTSADFASLNHLLTVQTQQTLANEATTLPGVASNLLKQFQANIDLMKQQKLNTSTFEQMYAQDQQQAQTIAAAPTLAKYTDFVTSLRQQDDKIALPLLQAKANSDMAALNQLVAQAQATKTVDPANGIAYPNAYEYADPNTGVGDASQRLANAQTLQDYQLVDNEIMMFTYNIQAMLQDLKDPSFNVMSGPNAYWMVPHATDLSLMKTYGVMSTRVIVVSFVEQAARLYDNGTFVKGFKVTTGAQDLPSVPGMHCVLDHLTDTVFKSPDPVGSPNYYLPTPIHYAMDYSYYGYALHDAWWRSWFGRYSNLPHYDPAAFNGGSHGCINFNYTNGDAAYVFNFAQVGTPVIVY